MKLAIESETSEKCSNNYHVTALEIAYLISNITRFPINITAIILLRRGHGVFYVMISNSSISQEVLCILHTVVPKRPSRDNKNDYVCFHQRLATSQCSVLPLKMLEIERQLRKD